MTYKTREDDTPPVPGIWADWVGLQIGSPVFSVNEWGSGAGSHVVNGWSTATPDEAAGALTDHPGVPLRVDPTPLDRPEG